MRPDELSERPLPARRFGPISAALNRPAEGLPWRFFSLIPTRTGALPWEANLPGQPKAIKECLDAVFPAIPYCIDLLEGPYLTTDESKIKAFRPKK